jgi:CDP-2,3-bis-(O-geranylgeranyl)-sn-glycerol synthase
MSQEALARAAFLLLAMGAAGAAHVLWLHTPQALRFAWPVDGGLSFRGRRLFGDNKRVCGFMVLPPAAALSFLLLGGGREALPSVFADGLWPLGAAHYAGIGLVCGLAFMLAELPNSFLKRQLGVAPGEAPAQPWLRPVVMLVDRLDSVLGVLLALSLMVPVPPATWLWVLAFGPLVHGGFSMVMHGLGIKQRPL